MFRIVRRSLERCKLFFDKHYLLANMAIYGGLYSCGDITCQLISHANTPIPLDWERTKRMGTIGCTVLPVMNTYYYRFLDRTLIGSSPRIVFTKLMLDTFTWSPVILAIFIAGLTALEGKSWPEIKEELKVKFFPVFKSGLMIWPVAQVINFAFVHPRFRMAYISVVGFCWINILSYLKHKHVEHPLPEKLD